jgi:hypothetical protein
VVAELGMMGCLQELQRVLERLHIEQQLRMSLAQLGRAERAGAELSVVATMQLFMEALGQVAEVTEHRVASATHQFQQRTVGEVMVFFQRMHPQLRPTLLNCTPYDVAAFVTQGWLMSHAGRHFSAHYRRLVPCAEYVRKCLGALRSVLNGLGRLGPWQVPAGPGNPVSSELIRRWYTGYAQLLFHEGYVESRAVPLTEARLEAVVEGLREWIAQELLGSVQRAVLLRDLCCMLYLWVSAQRGHECGELVCTDFTLPGLAAEQGWGAVAAGVIPAGGHVIVEPSHGTKARQHARPGEIVIAMEPERRAAYCLLRWLPVYAAAMAACGSPVVHWVFKPLLEPLHVEFREGSLGSKAMNAAYQRHVHACKFFMGETLHGIRRGRYQHQRYELGMTRQQIADSALVSDLATVDRYLHRTAHAERVRRAEQLWGPELAGDGEGQLEEAGSSGLL